MFMCSPGLCNPSFQFHALVLYRLLKFNLISLEQKPILLMHIMQELYWLFSGPSLEVVGEALRSLKPTEAKK